VFNALSSSDLLVGVGRVLRMVAAQDGGLEDFQRSQVLSAFSVTRLLASEQQAEAKLLADTRRDLREALAGDERAEAVRASERVDGARNGVEIGEAIGELLAELPRADPLRPRVHAALRTMIDAEVTALATPPA
jgi:hypothetical protein